MQRYRGSERGARFRLEPGAQASLTAGAVLFLFLLALIAPVIGGSQPDHSEPLAEAESGPEPLDRPNILWVVWDSVRADHISLYGYEEPTTPYLEEWSQQARVFENCLSPGVPTVPSHASMFTGLLPAEHGTNYAHRWLDERRVTMAELLRANGYETYMYSANPYISKPRNFHQGFGVHEYPWQHKYQARARAITRAKLSLQDKSHKLWDKLGAERVDERAVMSTGKLAQEAVEAWLETCQAEHPFFIFLNYMEAHWPLIPAEKYRRELMTPEEVERSYQVDRAWVPWWGYTFGVHEYRPEELSLTAATYDAALLELDDLFRQLLQSLEEKGYLENTIVILTSDHGEHLGEHHLFDHQYSVYEELVRVPLVIHYPARFRPGRDSRPAMNFDVFPTLLELTGIDPPPGLGSKAVSLLGLLRQRVRLVEYPAYSEETIKGFLAHSPLRDKFDPRPWRRSLRGLIREPHKFIWASDGRHELYLLDEDPHESRNLIEQRPKVARQMEKRLESYLAGLQTSTEPKEKAPALSAEELRRLRSLGYAGGWDEEEESDDETP